MKAALAALAIAGCAGVQEGGGPTLVDALEAADARIMWVGAHPDDETLASSVLSFACIARD